MPSVRCGCVSAAQRVRRGTQPVDDAMTANKADAEVLHEILRKIKELEDKTCEQEHPSNDAYKDFCKTLFWRWNSLKRYIKGMAKRASAKKGGLGRK